MHEYVDESVDHVRHATLGVLDKKWRSPTAQGTAGSFRHRSASPGANNMQVGMANPPPGSSGVIRLVDDESLSFHLARKLCRADCSFTLGSM